MLTESLLQNMVVSIKYFNILSIVVVVYLKLECLTADSRYDNQQINNAQLFPTDTLK